MSDLEMLIVAICIALPVTWFLSHRDDSPEPEYTFEPEEVDCPVCAERRKKNAARMKRYRDKRRAK